MKPYHGPWVLRTVLFVPGHIDKMLKKGSTTDADCVVLDLEDAVPEDQKRVARTKILETLASDIYSQKTVFVRINPLETGLTLRDLEVVACRQLHGFVYPMAYTPDDIKAFDAQLGLIEAHLGIPKGHFSIIILIETPLAVINAYPLAVSSKRVVGLLFGCEDYIAEMQSEHTENEVSLLAARMAVVHAARAAGIEPIDTPYVWVKDLEGLVPFARQARSLGMGGMLVMTPKQIELVNEVYTPTKTEIEDAESVVDAANAAKVEGRGISVVEGQFVSPPTVKAARKLLARQSAIWNIQAFGRGQKE